MIASSKEKIVEFILRIVIQISFQFLSLVICIVFQISNTACISGAGFANRLSYKSPWALISFKFTDWLRLDHVLTVKTQL